MKVCPTCKAEYQGGEVFCPVDASRLLTPSVMSAQPLTPDTLVGKTLSGRYTIIRKIGEGGMGIVYEAEHILIEKRVALKVLRDDFSKRTEVVERFRQEAKSASRIGHEHIVDISDFGETPRGQSYFVMEYLEGEDLANILAREGSIKTRRAIEIAIQCCRALGAAHAKGIVHRDMKPENIFLIQRDGVADFVKIVDFGIAKMSDIETEGAPGRKLTKTGMIFGTPEYMSPEQASGKKNDHRVDIYALAVILYECVAGRVPFVGDSFMGVLTQHMFEEAPPISKINPNVRISPELEAVIAKGIAKEAAHRYQTMDAFGEDLSRVLALETGDPTLPGYGERVIALQKPVRLVEPLPSDEVPVVRPRSRSAARIGIFAAVAVLLGFAGMAVFLVVRPDTTTANDTAPPVDPPPARPPPPPAVADPPPTAGGPSTNVERPVEPAGDEARGVEPPRMVQVTLSTRPAGARISIDGRGEVCESTPCSFETPPGETIQVRARRGRLLASHELTPTSPTTVEIELGARRAGNEGSGSGSGGRQGGPPDLKIPDIFR